MPSSPIDSDAPKLGFRDAASVVSDRQRRASGRAHARRCEPRRRVRGGSHWSALPAECGTRRAARVRSASSSFTSQSTRQRMPVRAWNFLASHSMASFKPEMIQDRRPQIGRDLPDRLDAELNQPDQRLQLVHEPDARPGIAPAQLVDEPHELELQAGEHLPEVVVELARDTGALFLARELEPKRELVQTGAAGRPRGVREPPAAPQASASSAARGFNVQQGGNDP